MEHFLTIDALQPSGQQSVSNSQIESALTMTQKNFRVARNKSINSIDYQQKGLPTQSDLLELAADYRKLQKELWAHIPDCPWVNEELAIDLSTMVAQFVQAHNTEQASTLTPVHPNCKYGSAYIRFSDEKNNPRSLAQQLHNILNRAAADGTWISFKRVFADAAISGTTSTRPGFQLAKITMSNVKEEAGVLYIDDLSRLSRDMIDMLEFAKQLKYAEKQIIGVSDGFDSKSPMSSIALPLSAVQHSEFIRGLREKVIRGAKDSFKRKRNTGAVPFGYKPFNVMKEDGQPELRRNGTVETVIKVVPEEAASVIRMFELYTNEHKSPNQIAKIFNQELVGGRNSWNSTSIAGMLKNVRYRGLIVYNRTQTVLEPSTGVRGHGSV